MASVVPARAAPEPQRVVENLRSGGPALVALSGGVDSSLVASFALEALGPRAAAVTLCGPAVAASEVQRAQEVARAIGISHILRPVDPLEIAEYRANPANRCFFCRTAESEVLLTEARARGLTQLVDGVHLDDLTDDRPGLKAMERAGFHHPLAEAGFTKEDVRREAHRRQLPNWDQPSDACLASRVRHGLPITTELLARIERGEAIVRAAGFRQVRLRIDGATARLEVGADEVARLLAEPQRSEITRALARAGFPSIELDPLGYRGSRPDTHRPA